MIVKVFKFKFLFFFFLVFIFSVFLNILYNIPSAKADIRCFTATDCDDSNCTPTLLCKDADCPKGYRATCVPAGSGQLCPLDAACPSWAGLQYQKCGCELISPCSV